MVNLDLQNRSRRTDGWSTVLDSLLVGITHNISNRIATLSGVSDILSGDPTIPPILRALADEVPRLEESIRLLRILAIPEDERDEAVEATRLVSDAIALARLHPLCHGIRFEAGDGRAVPPVLTRPTALTHEIVVALITAATDVAAGDSGSDHGGTLDRDHAGTVELPVTCSSEGDDLVIAVGRHMVRARLLTAAAR
ncbi:MAG: hypothetical protein M3Z05_20935 [Gemmatimonadota bacterium]|nr:hypothetical protein [Gemmatimonadota bacterium]